jgi:hypothetical protein
MEKTILIVLLSHRHSDAVKVQKFLTEYGCIVKTRLGIHDGVLGKCSDTGLIILELVGPQKEKKELTRKLKTISKIKVKYVTLSCN